MRSIVLALALAAPMSAVAAPNTFTRPSRPHVEKPQMVLLTFVNNTSQDREIVVGNLSYKVRDFEKMRVELPVGSELRMYSETNSKINGQVLMQVTADDQSKDIVLH